MVNKAVHVNSYEVDIIPLNASDMWPPTIYLTSLPPKKRKMLDIPQIIG